MIEPRELFFLSCSTVATAHGVVLMSGVAGLVLVIGDHNGVSDFQNSLILIADEFLYPGIILAEVTNVGFRQKFPVGGKDGHR